MGQKLLVADDSATIQKVIKLALSSEHYTIFCVSDGKELIRFFESQLPDLVLIDVVLPSLDAVAVKEKINQNPAWASVPFIVMSSAFEKVDESKLKTAGFQGRLIKPFDPSLLRKTVSQWINQSILQPVSQVEAPVISESSPSSIPPPPSATIEEETLPPSLPPTPEEEFSIEQDIQDLTQSTIQVSGFDDLSWSLDDRKKMKTDASQPRFSEISKSLSPHAVKANQRTKTLKLEQEPNGPIDDGGTTFQLNDVYQLNRTSHSPTHELPANFQEAPAATPESLTALMKSQKTDALDVREASEKGFALSLTAKDIEAMVQRDLRKMLEDAVQKLVPQIAEELIRKEIDKILNESSA